LRQDGEVSIDKVDPDSPAADAGILAKDLLLAVDGADASKARLFPLRRLLSTPHKTVRLELRRGDRKFDVTLTLPASPIGSGVARKDGEAAPPQKSAQGPRRRIPQGSKR
jgi:S1-C subfamily serine protease